ncbi:G-protein coupled receptor Mth2-like isoform X2 [Nylanderia fulva]|uniref:G-protein coupled receptor Mth2-like isoform X2 n=1 Tax=Nylanderia fulva TaxID=613905 RepID=UPI0010FB4644|nr:G-protein coupled receptor Mth2-like isoform X2 [Nylanderia fulva]
MYEKNHVFWYCAFLLVASSSQDLTNDNKDIQYDDMQNESSTMSNYWQNDNLKLRNELTTQFIENHWNENLLLMQSQQSTHAIEINDKKNFTTQEIHENGMKIEDENSSMPHDILKNFNTNNKNNFVPLEMCGNIICIQLCCPIGKHLINGNCIAEENEYIFSNLNRYINNLLQNKNERMDGLFYWTIREPYDETEFINLGHLNYNETWYTIFANGTLFFSYTNVSIESTNYCLSALDQNNFDTSIRSKALKKAYRDLLDHDSDKARELLNIHIIILILRLVSMLFMLITFLIYSILPELRNIHGFILRNYCALMFVAYMADMMNNEVSGLYVEYPMCITIALACYFCYLATCFWLTVMSFDMWWTFRDFNSLQRSGKQQERKKMILYSLYAWGSSFICTIICVIINFIPNVSEYLIPPKLGIFICWFNALKITRYEKDTAQHMKDSESRLYHKNKKWFKLYFKLFVIVFIMVGVTWIMAILFWQFSGSIKRWHQFLIYSMDMMQSFGIFIIFVCKKSIKQLLLKQFDCQNCNVFPKTRRLTSITEQNTSTTTLGTTSL